MRFDAGVDHEWSRAAPVLLIGEGSDPVDVSGRIRASERDPEPVVQRACGELGVIHEDEEGEGVEG